MGKPTKSKKPRKKSGPEPQAIKITGDWREAIKKSFTKKKPAKGWPRDVS